MRARPADAYLEWLTNVSREDQFTSAVVIGELYKGAYRAQASERHLKNIEQRILPSVTTLPFDVGTAKVYGKIRAHLEETRTIIPDADLQLAATALYHGLELVTGNLLHFQRINGLKVNAVLAISRRTE